MHIPKEIDAAVKERALRMFADHRQDDPSDTALAEAVANKVGVGRETARRWLVQADVNAGALPGASSDEQAEIKRLKAEVKKLREDNEILKAATVFFAGELDPRGRVPHHRPPDARPGHERSPRGKQLRTTIPARDGQRARDLLDRDFTAPAPSAIGRVLCFQDR